MIYLLYGEDTYRSWQKLQAIKKRYIGASSGDTDLIVLEGGELTAEAFARQTQALPFLAKHRLVIVRDLLRDGKKEIQEAVLKELSSIPATTILFFYDAGSLDKRGKLFHVLNQPKQAQEFPLLTGHKLLDYVKQTIAKEGIQISELALERLVSLTGSDLWRVHNEIEKLALFKISLSFRPIRQSAESGEIYNRSLHRSATLPSRDDKGESDNPQSASFDEHQQREAIRLPHEALAKGGNSTIEQSDIDLIIGGEPEVRIFDLTDAFGLRDSNKALTLLRQLDPEENSLGLLAMIAGHYRNLLLVADGQKRKVSRGELAKELKLHPYVFDKVYAQASRYTYDELVSCYKYLFQLDLLAKQSVIDPRVGLTTLAASLTAKPLSLPELTEENMIQ